jgi:Tfp pilus assembly protein PilP
MRMARGTVGWLMAAFVLAACGTLLAQTAKPAPAVPAAAAPAKPTPPDTFTYRVDTRRDPFVSLVNRTLLENNRPTLKKPEGVGGLSWAEISLVGIMQAKGKASAIVRAPDNREYRLHVGDQLFDCSVKAITADTLTVLQEVNDPLSLAKVRERSKTLRVVEEVK